MFIEKGELILMLETQWHQRSEVKLVPCEHETKEETLEKEIFAEGASLKDTEIGSWDKKLTSVWLFATPLPTKN